MTTLIQLALAPAAILLVYFFIRDKYEKEPIRLLAIGVIFGMVSAAVILAIDFVLVPLTPAQSSFGASLYTAFIVSAGVEESVKFLFLYFLVWRNKNFNERFDGIVYAVFISLGFAGVENVIYVTHPNFHGVITALGRAIFSVPGHGLFGVAMGYYFALAKFEPEKSRFFMFQAWAVPWLLHGIYNLILLTASYYYMVFFLPFVGYLWVSGLKKMKWHLENSVFKNT